MGSAHPVMPPKKKDDKKSGGKSDSKKNLKDFLAKSKSGDSAKKKKWSKGKVREKLNNMVCFDQNTYDRMMKEAAPSSWSPLPLSPSASRSTAPLLVVPSRSSLRLAPSSWWTSTLLNISTLATPPTSKYGVGYLFLWLCG